MGRYAFFNTDFEYKFTFTVQSSYDMQKFGGTDLYDEEDLEHLSHKWTQEDLNISKFELIKKFINFDIYEKSLKGTNQLYYDLCDLCDDSTFRLGCLIYHQLLYTKELICRYEL
jgi:hypothetical protein